MAWASRLKVQICVAYAPRDVGRSTLRNAVCMEKATRVVQNVRSMHVCRKFFCSDSDHAGRRDVLGIDVSSLLLCIITLYMPFALSKRSDEP